MRYFGSKTSTIEILYNLISERFPKGSFCDPFGGIGTVASYFHSKGYMAWSGDILTFPYYFQIARMKIDLSMSFKKLIKELNLKNHYDIVKILNSIPSKNGWFTFEYSEKRNFFTKLNAQKIQACRLIIKKWTKSDLINNEEKALLLASLINSMDRVANTAGTYYAYLKNWHRKALNDFQFEFIKNIGSNKGKGNCFHEPASSLVKRNCFDVLYLDPPYNERSYAHYYHLPETIALQTTPKVHGKSGIPDKICTFSDYNKLNYASSALRELLYSANFKLLVFHYADNGIIPVQKVLDILSEFGQIDEYIIESKGYSTIKTYKKSQHHLYFIHNA